ncbi:MAG: gliding motility-associated C-terminal domain-containing protein [Flavobacteriales bacterium]|nr:hypothetical protein [Flavobacteriales bacterium]MCC6577676.1 gliding motility-associated C-terminal domain-containing protein [Flavobacteriales bacterium]NUQ16068.1 gliding motility-associated C-terminal domain-containing protein [Flavobacteriales bacterium]
MACSAHRAGALFAAVSICLLATAQGRVRFVENKGQWPAAVRFKADVPGATVWCEGSALLIDRFDARQVHAAHAHEGGAPVSGPRPVIPHHALRLHFTGAGGRSATKGLAQQPGLHHFFVGNDPAHWGRNARAFAAVEWSAIAPGIALRLTTTATGLKYDLHLAPGADPRLLELRYEGADAVRLEDDHLVIATALGPVVERVPLAYQVIGGRQVPVRCGYRLKNDRIGFALGTYDPRHELVIDPTLEFSTYSGSTSDNFGYTATFDELGFLYSGSSSFGSGYPTTTGAYQTTWSGGDGQGTIAGTDMAITKYDTSGTFLVWSTMLGGQGDDLPHSLIVNGADEVFILGTTGSPDHPTTPGALQPVFAGGSAYTPQGIGVSYPSGSDMVVARLSADGSQLLAATFLGGTQNDGHNSAAALKYNYADEMRGEVLLKADGTVIVMSCTQSTDYPVSANAPQPAFGGGTHDGVITTLTADLGTLVWSTFLGGGSADAVFGGELFNNGDLLVCGGTNSTDLPVTTNAYQGSFQGGLADAFAARIAADGSTVQACTYYGSSAYDQAYFADLDDQENVFLFGQTQAPGTALILNAPYNVPNSGQFIAKLSPDLQSWLLGSRFGLANGTPSISPTAFLVDHCDKLYVSGWGSNIGIGPPMTTTGLPVTPDAYQGTTTGNDLYLAVFEVDMSALAYATYFGGNASSEHVDGGTSRFDRRGRVYQSVCAGCGGNSDFPIAPDPGAWSPTNNSTNCNNGVFKFDFDAPLVVAAASAPDTVCANAPVVFANYSNGSTYLWTFGDGASSTQTAPTHTYPGPGHYNVTLTAFDPASCNGQDQTSFTVVVTDAAPTLEAMPDTLLCGPLDSFVLSATSHGTATGWHWSTNGQFTDMLNTSAADSTALVQPAASGTYHVRADAGGCTVTDSVTVTVSLVDIALSPGQLICADEQAQLVLSGADPGSTIVWSPAQDIVAGQGTPIATVAPQETTTFGVAVTAASGCSWNGTVTVQVSPVNAADVNATVDQPIVLAGTQVQLHATPGSGVTYSWTPTTVSDPTIADPTAVVETSTWFVVTVSDGICTRSDSVLVTVHELHCDEPDIFVPNAFTPNGDGHNDVLFVRGRFITALEFKVFDRWGEKVFETTDLAVGWDATYQGRAVDPAVFVYHLRVRCADGQELFKKGNVTVIR